MIEAIALLALSEEEKIMEVLLPYIKKKAFYCTKADFVQGRCYGKISLRYSRVSDAGEQILAHSCENTENIDELDLEQELSSGSIFFHVERSFWGSCFERILVETYDSAWIIYFGRKACLRIR